MVASFDAVTPLSQGASRNREVRTVVFTDIVESTQLKRRLGDARAIALFEEHDAAIRRLLTEYTGTRELGVAGDSFTLSFIDAADALLFSLRVHRALEKLGAEDGVELRVRIGIHTGDLFVDESAQSGRPIGGLVLDVCSRIMSLGDRGQTLLSRLAFDESRRALGKPEASWMGGYEWLSHGLYQLKGTDEPLEICEVGKIGVAPLNAPAHAEKARRLSFPDGELVLGWRPAVGREVPGTSWKLERALGEGGFGEVWLGQHTVLKERRVFKFCFRADRVRSLKREVTLFRVLRERVGHHPNIVNFHDVYLSDPPFYVAMDFVEGNALPEWVESQGGIEAVPVEARVEIVAQVADALHAAHKAGVLHRDVKPANILLSGNVSDPRAKLSDFGIGQVLSLEALGNVTAHGLTQTLMGSSSGSGTQMYLAPEVVRGQASSPQSDIFALGVVLFQAYIGDFYRPLTTDWEEMVHDAHVREDLKHCFASDPTKRFPSADRFAESLRRLPERRAAAEARRAEVAAAERRAFRAGVVRTSLGALAVVALVTVLALFAWGQAGRARKSAAAADSLLMKERQRRAETLFEHGRTPAAMAYLAAVVRKDPKAESATERLVNALLHRPMAWPTTAPLAHEAYVSDLAITPDGSSLLVITESTARLWDIATGKERFPALPIGGQKLALSLNGSRAVIAGEVAHWIDLTTFKILERWEAPRNVEGGVVDVDFRPQGDAVAVLNGGDELALRDPRSGVMMGKPLRTGGALSCVRFSPDGTAIAASDAGGSLMVWDFATREVRWQKQLSSPVRTLAWHPTGDQLVAGAADGTIQLLIGDAGEIGQVIKAGSEIVDVSYSPDGGQLLGASTSGRVYIRSSKTGEAAGEISENEGLRQARYSDDGSLIIVGNSEGLVKFYDSRSFRPALEPLECDALPRAVRAGRNSSLAIGGEDGRAQIWKTSARAMKPMRIDHGAVVKNASLQSGGKTLVTAGEDGRLLLWDLEKPAASQELADAGNKFEDFAATEGAVVVCPENGSSLRLVQMPDGKWSKPQKSEPAKLARFSRDGSHYHLIRVDRKVQLFETATGKPVSKPIGKNVADAVIGRSGRDLIWIEDNKRVLRLDVKSGVITNTPISHKSEVTRLSVSPSGQWIASIANDGAAVWNLNEGSAPPKYLPQGNLGETFEFSADDKWGVATNYHHVAYVWQLPDGVRMPESLNAEGKRVSLARFFPGDSRRIWTVDLDAVRLWDARTSMPLSDSLVKLEGARSVAASVNGRRIAMICKNSPSVLVMDTPPLDSAAPEWLADWAEAAGGFTLGEDGLPVRIPIEKRSKWLSTASQMTGPEVYTHALKWWLADSNERSSSPYSLLREGEEGILTRHLYPLRDARATLRQIDLTPHYNARLGEDPTLTSRDNTLKDLAADLHHWDGLDFDVRGLVQFGMKGGNMERFAARVTGIKIAQICRALHLVGAVRNIDQRANGEEILRLVAHYEDGTTAEGVMHLGVDVSDWWVGVLPAEDRLIWTGTNPAAMAKGNDIGVYHMKWDNPRPDDRIVSLDLVAPNRHGAPFIVAITAEPK